MSYPGFDAARYVESANGKDKLNKCGLDLWNYLPAFVHNYPGVKNLSPAAKGYLALRDAQAKYWYTAYDLLTCLLKSLSLFDLVESEKSKLETEKMIKSIKAFNSSPAGKSLQGKGGRPIDCNYQWLLEWHDVPSLRRALGMSDEGIAKLLNRLKISSVKNPGPKNNIRRVGTKGALMLLSARLSRPANSGTQTARAIWDKYASKQMGKKGYFTLYWLLAAAASWSPEAVPANSDHRDAHAGEPPTSQSSKLMKTHKGMLKYSKILMSETGDLSVNLGPVL